MSQLKYERLYNSDNEIVKVENAVRGEGYKLYVDEQLLYTYKEGPERKYFSLIAIKKESNNPFASTGGTGGGGESAEHYNAKMKIADELKYFDTVFNTEVCFDKVIPEKYFDIKKKPDLSCYNNGVLVACIEIFNTSKKTESDIEILKELDCLIIEIDINYGNRCTHIALPKVFEFYRNERFTVEKEIRESERKHEQTRAEYNRVADNIKDGFSKLARAVASIEDQIARGRTYRSTEIENIEDQIKSGRTNRIQTINSWLQRRKPTDKSKEFFRHYGTRSSTDVNREIKEIRNQILEVLQEIRLQQTHESKRRGTADVAAKVKSLAGAYKSVEDAFRNKDYGKLKKECLIFIKQDESCLN